MSFARWFPSFGRPDLGPFTGHVALNTVSLCYVIIEKYYTFIMILLLSCLIIIRILIRQVASMFADEAAGRSHAISENVGTEPSAYADGVGYRQ